MPRMGLGVIGNPQVIFKRKFRWSFIINCPNQPVNYSVPESFVKTAARPKMTVENVEVPYKNSTLNVPGKAKFESITVNYYDVAIQDAANIYNWVNLQNNQLSATAFGNNNINKWDQNELRGWYSEGILTMYDGCGVPIESWVLHYLYPTSVDWGDLAYDSSEIAEISITMQYSEVSFRNEGCFSNLVFNGLGCTAATIG